MSQLKCIPIGGAMGSQCILWEREPHLCLQHLSWIPSACISYRNQSGLAVSTKRYLWWISSWICCWASYATTVKASGTGRPLLVLCCRVGSEQGHRQSRVSPPQHPPPCHQANCLPVPLGTWTKCHSCLLPRNASLSPSAVFHRRLINNREKNIGTRNSGGGLENQTARSLGISSCRCDEKHCFMFCSCGGCILAFV